MATNDSAKDRWKRILCWKLLMAGKIWVAVSDQTSEQSQLLFMGEANQEFMIGRQESQDSYGEYAIGFFDRAVNHAGVLKKLVIAAENDSEYSRDFAKVEIKGEQVRVTNCSAHRRIFTDDGTILEPNKQVDFHIPFAMTLVDRTIRFFAVNRLPAAAPPDLQAGDMLPPSVSLAQVSEESTVGGKRMVELLKTVMQFFQESPSTQKFFEHAARSISQLLELDHLVIAFKTDHQPDFLSTENEAAAIAWGHWRAVSFVTTARHESEWAPSRHILELVEKDKQTIFVIPEGRTQTLMSVKSLVASPLKNFENEIIGVIYGDRDGSNAGYSFADNAGSQESSIFGGPAWLDEPGVTDAVSNEKNEDPIGDDESFLETEAMFVELFANVISLGLERVRQDRKLSEMRARFDQFFTPRLARRLEADASMLEPRSAMVSVLFADIRGFSRIAERVGPEKTIHWINDVMNQLSDCVFQLDGVVVDYVGDEIMAMWGAPVDQPNHAELAVRAALAMLARLPGLNQRWEEVLGEAIDLGIGINSGEAQVGNTGSDKKFKYGPLGDVVNVSSRLQNATKQFHCRIMATGDSAKLLPPDLPRRKIRNVQFVNVERAITVYEIPFCPDANWMQLKAEYEAGLAMFEKNQLPQVSEKMGSIMAKWSGDGPSMLLLSDAVKFMQKSPERFTSVWKLIQK